MAKIKQVIKSMTESFSEFVLRKDQAIEVHELQHDYTIEQAKIKSYEVRRHMI
ncbi:MAG: hypothetical protein H7256_06665 [Bdellovibrio sp.]|nr:hypothetical protein [Bdellovibrio sp.]